MVVQPGVARRAAPVLEEAGPVRDRRFYYGQGRRQSDCPRITVYKSDDRPARSAPLTRMIPITLITVPIIR